MSAKKEFTGWCEIRIEGPTATLEAVAEFLTSIGSGGAIFSAPARSRRGYERLTGFLANDQKLSMKLTALNRYLDELRKIFPEQTLSRPEIQTIVDRDWINQWRETVVPTRVSNKFWVVPEWSQVPKAAKAPGVHVIFMEPGLAFGTGFHTTTQLCIDFLELLVPEKTRTMIDLGTGTGILAMVGARLGANKILAVDNDPLSIKVAEENITRNHLEGKIQLIQAGDSTKRRLSRSRFGLVAANLFVNELIRLRDYIAGHLKPGGYLIMSGILPDQTKELLKSYRAAGFKTISKREKQGWAAILMKKD